MIRATIFSDDKEVVSYTELIDERVVKVGSYAELLHYIPPFVRLVKFGRGLDKEGSEIKEPVIKSEGETDKPLNLDLKILNLNLD